MTWPAECPPRFSAADSVAGLERLENPLGLREVVHQARRPIGGLAAFHPQHHVHRTTAARAAAMSAPSGTPEKAAAENQLSGTLKTLFAVSEAATYVPVVSFQTVLYDLFMISSFWRWIAVLCGGAYIEAPARVRE